MTAITASCGGEFLILIMEPESLDWCRCLLNTPLVSNLNFKVQLSNINCQSELSMVLKNPVSILATWRLFSISLTCSWCHLSTSHWQIGSETCVWMCNQLNLKDTKIPRQNASGWNSDFFFQYTSSYQHYQEMKPKRVNSNLGPGMYAHYKKKSVADSGFYLMRCHSKAEFSVNTGGTIATR